MITQLPPLCPCCAPPPNTQMIHYYRRQHGTGLPLRHTLTVGLHVASALWHLHPSIVHRWAGRLQPAQRLQAHTLCTALVCLKLLHVVNVPCCDLDRR